MGSRADWDRNYYENNKEKAKASHLAYNRTHPDVVKKAYNKWKKSHPTRKGEIAHKYASKIRMEFLSLYGGRCACCGESEPRFLTIDHVNGQTGIAKKEHSYVAYKRAIEQYPSPNYRILCWNCNCARRWGQVCPHQEKIDVRG